MPTQSHSRCRAVAQTVLALALLAPCALAQPATLAVDWPAFLGRQDPIWQQLPPAWNAGGFTGNGELGMVVFAPAGEDTIEFHIGREDVTDHRGAPTLKTAAFQPGASTHYSFPRLDLGRLEYHPAGRIVSGTMRQVLWDAEVDLDFVTTLGKVHLRAFTDAVRMVQVVEVTSNETQDNSPATGHWEFRPGVPDAPRRMVFPQEAAGQGYPPNPGPVVSEAGPIHLCTQSLLAGGDYATAWSATAWATEHGVQHSTLLLTTANDVPAAGTSAPHAAATLQAAGKAGNPALTAEHRAWWHALYPASFIALPDPQMEAFYWIQIYKIASATRDGGDLIDDDGPWMRVNQWPYATWNLNVQLTYWLTYASNHPELGRSLTEYIDRHFDQMAARYEGKPSLGDLAWALHDYWWQARFEGDRKLLDQGWYPKVVSVAAAYHGLLAPGPDGRLHLPPMLSPEYPAQVKNAVGLGNVTDSSYNLALCRWVLQTLLDTAAAEHRDPALQAVWAADLKALAPLPTGLDGIQIGSDQPVAISHRHFSHLLAIYPLYELDANTPADRELMERSIEHWQTIQDGKALAGYSYTGAAKLYAAMHQGDRAYAKLKTFLNEVKGISRLYPNTFYGESDGRNPVIETPLSAGSAMLDLLLQSTPRAIEVFPAVPAAWQDASFFSLRAAGGFLLSAARRQGATQWVQVTSLKGEPLTLRVEGWQGDLHVLGTHPRLLHPDQGVYHLTLASGETILLSPDPAFQPASARVTAPPAVAGTENPWGLKSGMATDFGRVWPEVMPPPAATP